MSGTQLRDATKRAAADVVAAFYDYNSPYGPGWRPSDGTNGLYGGTPTGARIRTTAGSRTITVVEGEVFGGMPLSVPGIPASATADGYANKNATTTMSVVASSTGEFVIPLVRLRDGNLWMTALAVNADYWLWRGTQDVAAKQRVIAMGSYLTSPGGWDFASLNGDGSDGSAYLLDDAGWKVQMLFQIYELGNDARFRTAGLNAIAASLRRFVPPDLCGSAGATQRCNRPVSIIVNGASATAPDGQPFYYWNHGAAYKQRETSAGADNRLNEIASLYEALLAMAAIDASNRFDAGEAYYTYALATYNRMLVDFAPKPGDNAYGHGRVFHTDYVYSTQTSTIAYFGYPKVGATPTSVHLSMMMAVLAARLRQSSRSSSTLKASLVTDISSIISGVVQSQENYGSVTSSAVPRPEGGPPVSGIFIQGDSWTGMSAAAAFAAEVLTIPGVDANNTCALVLAKTAAGALATRTSTSITLTSNYRYTADWAGLLQDANGNPKPAAYGGDFGGYTGYEPKKIAEPETGFAAIAGSAQIMTNVNALLVATGGAIVEAAGNVTLPTYSIPAGASLTDLQTGATLVDDTTNSIITDA